MSSYLSALTELKTVAIAGFAVTGLLIALRQLGGLQSLELAIFDQMTRLRPDRGADPRLLVVEVTEADIQKQPQRSLSDGILAQLLAQVQQHHPAAIGLDLDLVPPIKPGTAELTAQLRSSNIIVNNVVGNQESERLPPPPGVPQERVGFVDTPLDPDGIVRRNLLFNSDGTTIQHSFALRLVLTYINAGCPGYTPAAGVACQDIFENTQTNEYQLGRSFPKLTTDAGGYQAMNASGYKILLNYRSAHHVARQLTLTQVLNRKIDPSWIEGKIVLVGVSAPSFKDLFFTPFSVTASGHRQTSGVFLQAQMTSQLLGNVLDGQPLFWFWSEWIEILWIGSWAGASFCLTWMVRNPLILTLGGIGLLGLLLGCSFVLFLQYAWVPVAAPALAVVMVGGSTIACKQYQTQQQQQMVMRLLGQQTSPEIATTLWQGRHHLLKAGRLPWQKLTATVLFSDIKGFSAIAEQQLPEVVMGWLNNYLTVMAEEVQCHKGVTNKFIGDGIMAVFGVPVARTSEVEIAADAQRAVRCALAMRQRLHQMNQNRQRQGLPGLQMRVGIFTGPVMVGSLGGKVRLEYGVIGDSVNTASRLESCEKERQVDNCRVLIARETLDYLQGQFEVEPWGHLILRGKQRPVEVYRVL